MAKTRSRKKLPAAARRTSPRTGAEVPWGDVGKACEYSDDNYVILKDADFKKAAVKWAKANEIEQFVDVDAIRPIYLDKSYYLVADKHGDKGYALVRAALEKTGQLGVARVVIRSRVDRVCH